MCQCWPPRPQACCLPHRPRHVAACPFLCIHTHTHTHTLTLNHDHTPHDKLLHHTYMLTLTHLCFMQTLCRVRAPFVAKAHVDATERSRAPGQAVLADAQQLAEGRSAYRVSWQGAKADARRLWQGAKATQAMCNPAHQRLVWKHSASNGVHPSVIPLSGSRRKIARVYVAHAGLIQLRCRRQ
jgi:hypothetical protein